MTDVLPRWAVQAGLEPTPDEARSWLRQELLKPDYDQGNPLTRLLEWFARMFDGGLATASGAPLLTTLAALVIFAALVAAISWLAARARLTSRATKAHRPIGSDAMVSASEYRRRAQQFLEDGDFSQALIEAFRALARQQIESGRIEDVPQATAREVSALLATNFPDDAPTLSGAATLFDAVLYGDHAASLGEAQRVLALDERLGVRR